MPPIKRRHMPSLGSFATFEVAAKHLIDGLHLNAAYVRVSSLDV